MGDSAVSTSARDSGGSAGRLFFVFMVGLAALFIAGCSAYFSVQGLGLLFVGSATAVMVMAASLELGKLVAASFLYRYWRDIGKALRFYLLTAVILLVAITSLGNYGYLARAYERTNSQIAVLEEQVAAIRTEIDDTQQQISGSKQSLSKSSDIDRKDIDGVHERIARADQSLEQSLGRLEQRRTAAKEKRARDAELVKGQLTDQAALLKQGLDSEDAAVGQLNERVAVLDRAVDAYIQQGGPGFLKSDGVKKGQALRDRQQPERDAIAGTIAQRQQKQQDLRDAYAKSVQTINQQLASAEQQVSKDLAALDAEEAGLRKQRADAVAGAEVQVQALQAQNQTASAQGGNQIEGLHQRIRAGNEEIRRLNEEIAATDIGSYRFVARAFNAGADDIVKWLMLVLVLVFDPLAVTLTVGFNVALMRGKRPTRVQASEATEPMAKSDEGDGQRRSAPAIGRRTVLAGGALAAVCLVGGAVVAVNVGAKYLHAGANSKHATWIPADSFAVMRVSGGELAGGAGDQQLAELLGTQAAKPVLAAVNDLLAGGFDRGADLYVFAKFPSASASSAASTAKTGDRPVMLFGLVARVTDARTAEAGLSHFSDTLMTSLGGKPAVSGGTARSRSMVKYGRGRYLDAEGGFFTFALADDAAIVLLEVEGDAGHSTVTNEIRQCLAAATTKSTETKGFGKASAKLPERAISGDGPVTLWFDAGRCFSQMPKNAVAVARFEQLKRHVGFNVLLTLKPTPGELELTADYAYAVDRFKTGGGNASAAETIARLGPAEPAGVAGQLMDRCAATLDYDGLNESLRGLFAGTRANRTAAQVLVEKTIASDRDGSFTLTAHYDQQSGPPPMAALEDNGR